MTDSDNSRRKFITTSTQGLMGAGLTLSAARWNSVRGANERVRLGVIGVGLRGQEVMSWFQKEPQVEVAAVCDCYDKHAQQAREKAGSQVQVHRDYRQLLDAKDIDAVLIATPDHWHTRMTVDACRAGKDVYVEKPLTFDIAEGHEIIKAVKEHKRVLQVGLQQRSGEHYQEAKREYVDTGKLGKIAFVRTWWHGNSYHLRKPNFTAQPEGLDWKAFLGPAKYREFNAHQFYNWRAYLDFGGGQITDLFTHWIDVVHWYLGEDLPVTASAAGGVFAYQDGRTAPDTISIQLQYPSRWVATFEATLVPGARGAAIEFLGTEGSLYIDRDGYKYQAQTPRKATAAEPITRKATVRLEAQHVANFLSCLKSRQTPNSDVVSGHRSALASHLGKIAYLKKERVTFDPVSEQKHQLS